MISVFKQYSINVDFRTELGLKLSNIFPSSLRSDEVIEKQRNALFYLTFQLLNLSTVVQNVIILFSLVKGKVNSDTYLFLDSVELSLSGF